MSSQDSGGMWLFGGPSNDEPSRKPEDQPAEPVAGPQAEGYRPEALPQIAQPPVEPSPVVPEPPVVRAIPPPPRVTPDESEYQTGLREPATPLWLQPNASPVQTSDHIEPEAPSWGSPPVDSTGSTRLRRLAPVLVGLLVAVVALAGGAAWFATRHDPVASGPASMTGAGDAGTNAPSTSASSSASTSASTSASASTTSDSSASEEPASTEPSDDDDAELTDEEAHQRLDELADEGLSDVSLDGQDVAMIASKWDGVVDPLQKTAKGRHRFYYVDILAEHDRLADEDNLGARVVMLRGSDYGKRASSPDGQEIYVTLALGDFGSPREVRTWCNDRFADLSRKKRDNQCVATKLTD